VLAHRRDGEPGDVCRLCELDRLLATLEELAELGGVNGLRSATPAEQALVEWAAVYKRRDDVIRTAHFAGMAKRRIHAITGISRTTIDAIVNGSYTNRSQTAGNGPAERISSYSSQRAGNGPAERESRPETAP